VLAVYAVATILAARAGPTASAAHQVRRQPASQPATCAGTAATRTVCEAVQLRPPPVPSPRNTLAAWACLPAGRLVPQVVFQIWLAVSLLADALAVAAQSLMARDLGAGAPQRAAHVCAATARGRARADPSWPAGSCAILTCLHGLQFTSLTCACAHNTAFSRQVFLCVAPASGGHAGGAAGRHAGAGPGGAAAGGASGAAGCLLARPRRAAPGGGWVAGKKGDRRRGAALQRCSPGEGRRARGRRTACPSQFPTGPPGRARAWRLYALPARCCGRCCPAAPQVCCRWWCCRSP
jgi:hypothetical protein